VTMISATLTAGTAVQLTGGDHTWRADEPEDVGGTDSGPTPYELLLGALAACTCMTVSLYAARRGIALVSVEARFSHDRTHRRDCEDCADERSAFMDRITGEIVIAADADRDQRRRLADVAVRCPVRRTLEADIDFSDHVRFEI
jgi:uncharacterized OsmC-like protein